MAKTTLPAHCRCPNHVCPEIPLSVRSLNSLYRGQIDDIPHLLQHTEADLLAIPNLGATAIQEIKAALAGRGFSLQDERAQRQAKTAELLEKQQEQNDHEEDWQKLKQLIGRQIGLTNPGFEKLVLFCSDYADDPAAQHLADILVRLKASLQFIGETLSREHRDHTESIQNALTILRDWIASQLLQRSCDAALQWVQQITKSFSASQERN
jgi:hypothetical protein